MIRRKNKEVAHHLIRQINNDNVRGYVDSQVRTNFFQRTPAVKLTGVVIIQQNNIYYLAQLETKHSRETTKFSA